MMISWCNSFHCIFFRWHFSYEGKCSDIAVLDDALQNGVKSEAFRSTIGWIANELSVLASLEEQVCSMKVAYLSIMCLSNVFFSSSLSFADKWDSWNQRFLTGTVCISEGDWLPVSKISHRSNIKSFSIARRTYPLVTVLDKRVDGLENVS